MESRVKIFEELVAPLNEAVQNGIAMDSDKVFSSYNHIYMTMIASSLCNISDKLDIFVEKMEELDKEEK